MLASLARLALRQPPDRIMQSVQRIADVRPRVSWIAALSLGTANDYSALALLRKQEVTTNNQRQRVYDCPFLQRYDKTTPYHVIAQDVAELCSDPQLQDGKPSLVLERTVIGQPVLDLFRRVPARLVPLSMTTAALSHAPDGLGGWVVPKVALTSLMQVLVSGRRPNDPEIPLFCCPAGVGEAAILLAEELATFTTRVQVSVNKDVPLVWRETANEDLCLAVACGCWAGEYVMRRLVIAV